MAVIRIVTNRKDWENFFQKTGIPEDTSKTYAKSFKNNHVTEIFLPELTKEFLNDLGITMIGDILIILISRQRNLHQKT